MTEVPGEPKQRESRYAVGAAMVLWYGPLLVALLVGPVAQSDSARAAWLRYFAVLPGLLAKSFFDFGTVGAQLAVGGVATVVWMGMTALLWARWRARRAPIAIVTLALSSTNAFILAHLFVL